MTMGRSATLRLLGDIQMPQDNESSNNEPPAQHKIQTIRIKNSLSKSESRPKGTPDFRRMQWNHANEMLRIANVRPEVLNNLEKLYFTMDAGYGEDFFDRGNDSIPTPTPVEMAAIAETVQLTLFAGNIQQYVDEEKSPVPNASTSSAEK